MENIKELYKELGFREDSIKQYNYQLALSNNSDKVAYSFAMKPLYDGTYLVAVVVRGVGYGAEWRSNLHVGNDTKHTGFNVSAEEVYTNLNTYMLENNLIKKNTKIWITGYSRGAAVANLVAGKINKNQIIESNNLYAYTFATPNGVIVDENNANDSIHDNIYNIVLPYDVVPRLALQKWGYGKYGKTLMVKNRNASKDKNRENEVYFYNHTDGKTYSIGKDQTKAAEKVAKTLASIAKTPLVYKSTYENLFMDVFEGLMCYGDLSLFLFDRYGDDEILQDALVFAHENDKHYLLWELVDSDIAIPTFALMYINGIRDNANTVIKEIIKTLGAIQLVGLFSSKDDYGNVINAHFPEYYISWLYGYNNPKEIYESSTYKKLTIACPVNVNIYDSMGTLVASVINNEVVVDILPVDVIGESSEIYFYENENIDDYTIEIEAYDEGEINYSVTEYENNGIEARKINYANIPVSTGTKLSGNIPKGQSLGAEVYNLTSITNEEETTIAFTEDLTNENLQNLSVAVTVEGDGSANDIYFATKGELVTLEAKPYYDASFIGWYNENEELISEDREYSFILSESMNVTAKFTKCTAVVFTMTPKISNNKLNISSVVSSAKDIDTQYIMAIYSGNNKLIDIKIIPVSLVGNTEEEVNETFNVSLLESTPAYVKLFLWSGINDLIPLCGSSKADVQ